MTTAISYVELHATNLARDRAIAPEVELLVLNCPRYFSS